MTIEVRNLVEAEGYGRSSVKAGIVSVQPPSAVMESMLTLRLHLHDCPEANGALRVVPGLIKVEN